MSNRNSKANEGPWVKHRLQLLLSPAWRLRPIPLARILERLEIEHMSHAGTANGELSVSYGQFVQCRVSRKAIAPALELGQHLGLLEVKPHSGILRGNIRNPNVYRLTYLPTYKGQPTDEWKGMTESRVKQLVAQFRKAAAGRKKPKQTGAETVDS